MQNVVVNIVREHLLTNLNLWADPALWDPKSVRLEAHSESWGDKNSGHVRRHFSSQSSQPPSLKCPLGIFNSLWAVLRGFPGPKKQALSFGGQSANIGSFEMTRLQEKIVWLLYQASPWALVTFIWFHNQQWHCSFSELLQQHTSFLWLL